MTVDETGKWIDWKRVVIAFKLTLSSKKRTIVENTAYNVIVCLKLCRAIGGRVIGSSD